jgi:hypothetical protein
MPKEPYHEIAELLDRVCYRSANSYEVSQTLRERAAAWQPRITDPEVRSALQRAQGVVGMINVTPEGDPLHRRARDDLVALKNEMRAFARGDPSGGE